VEKDDDDDDSRGECGEVEAIDDVEEEETETKSPSVLPSDGMNRRRGGGSSCDVVDGSLAEVVVVADVVVTMTVEAVVAFAAPPVELVDEARVVVEKNASTNGTGE
jgi:hypothetical protein